MKKMILVFSVVAMLTMAFASVASADTVTGRGWLKAIGAGKATLQMTGEVDITGHGTGVIYIKNAEIITAEGRGKRSNLPNGDVILRGYYGSVRVVGEQMSVQMVGGKIDFSATGAGVVTLKGRGKYWTHAGTSGNWRVDGVDLTVGEPELVQ